MKLRQNFIAPIFVISVITAAFTNNVYSQTNKATDYDSLIGIIPIIVEYKKDILFKPRPPIARLVPAPQNPSPTQPQPIYSTPSAPGKHPLVRWLLPGGPPPASTPVLPPLTCDYDDC